jgi:predicted nucleic acid-binding protein
LNPVLVDTSVWVDHFRSHNATLVPLLALDQVRVHPMVLGELACGTPPSRAQTLADLGRLQQMQQASLREVLVFIEKERLFGLGCGLVDITLLASTLMTPGAELWTLDKRLANLARQFAVAYQPAVH